MGEIGHFELPADSADENGDLLEGQCDEFLDNQFQGKFHMRELSRQPQGRWHNRFVAPTVVGLLLVAVLCAPLVLRNVHHVNSNELHRSSLQRKFGFDWIQNMWGKKDPYGFMCPLPVALMAVDWGMYAGKSNIKHNNSVHLGPVKMSTKGGYLDVNFDTTRAQCCEYYSKSWWPYLYSQCKPYGYCPSCTKASPNSILDTKPVLSALAGAGWAASSAVYEDKINIPLPGLGLPQESTVAKEILSHVSNGTRSHVTNVCPAMTDWQQYTFEYSFEHLRVRAYKSEGAKLAIIAFRGTVPTNLLNWLVDINLGTETLNLTKDKDGMKTKIHRGYLDGLRYLMPKIRSWIEGYMYGWGKVPNDWTLMFTGHSMGGAFATLAATMVFVENWERKPDAIVTFGTPRVADSELAKWWHQQGLCHKLLRVNVYNDAVHWWPFNKQSPTFKDFGRCSNDLHACLSLKPSKTGNFSNFDNWWQHVCPSSEFLVPGEMRGVNAEMSDFSMYGGTLAHTLDNCRYGYGYGIVNHGLASYDKYCGISKSICPEFKCVTVEQIKDRRCLGLAKDKHASSAAHCKERCCSDATGTCEVWQWIKNSGCWSGRSSLCKKIPRNSEWSDDVIDGGRIK